MSSTLKSKAIKGVIWSAVDKFATQAGQFIIGIVLARLLMPADYGLIGMLSIFIAISQSIIESGMSSGLIQKKNRSDIDFSTVFVFNFCVSVGLYLILYITAPLIANFYNMPQLVLLTRVLTLNLIVNSLSTIQRSKLIIKIDFKTIAKVRVVSVLLGGAVGVFFAYKGYGVWALVIKTIAGSIITMGMLWFLSKWKPSILFSWQSFKELFGYGSRLLAASIYTQVLQNIYKITIGKAYSAADLGFYSKAKSFSELTSGTVNGILHQVTFPILASLQDDRSKMISVYSRLIRMTAFVIVPAMTLLALSAEPFVKLFLTDKWLPAVALLQWMSFARMFTPISSINMNILNATGRSDLFLKVDLSKFPIIILALVITIPMGVKAIVIGHVVTSCISFFINAYLPGKFYGYGGMQQLRDMLPIFFASALMALLVYCASFLIVNLYIKLIVIIITGTFSYLLICIALKVREIGELKSLIAKLLKGKV